MANEQTSVPLYAAAEVLTAANMNISAGTGVPVFATTVTRDAAFGGASEKVLAEGQLCYLSSTNVVQYYDGAAWATVGPAAAAASGLTLVSATTVGTTVASVTVSSAFSATYDNYRIIYTGGVASAENVLQLTLGATTTTYYFSIGYIPYDTGTFATITTNNGSHWTYAGSGNTTITILDCDIFRPFAASKTIMTGKVANLGNAQFYGGYLNNSTSYTAFTVTCSTGTITGGTIRVYGYQNS